jgi:hypothetical protein
MTVERSMSAGEALRKVLFYIVLLALLIGAIWLLVAAARYGAAELRGAFGSHGTESLEPG